MPRVHRTGSDRQGTADTQEAASKIAEENLAQTLPGWKKCEAVWPKNIESFSRKLLA
jgi:hypothetical protein